MIRIFPILLGLIITALLWSCSDDDPVIGNLSELRFEQDTLRFDTVLTDQNTITELLAIYNDSNEPLLIEEVFLDDPSGAYTINISGVPSNEVSNLVIEAEDFVYLFIQANIDPQNADNPFIVEGNVIFESQNSQRALHLQAFGQDAIYLGSLASIDSISCEMGTEVWNSPKPYVVFGSLYIDDCQLELAAGTEIFMHGSAFTDGESVTNDGAIVFGENGNILSNGIPSNPVVIRSDRRDRIFENRAGQWNGLIFQENSTGNIFNSTIIQDAVVGITLLDSSEVIFNQSLIQNSFFQNILAQDAFLTATNSLIYGSDRQFNIQILQGGHYSFEYCTVSSQAEGNNAARILSAQNDQCIQDLNCEEANPLLLRIDNSILFGTSSNELFIDLNEELANDVQISNSVVSTNTEYPFLDNTFNLNPLFVDVEDHNYQLDSLSPVSRAGIPTSTSADFNGFPRQGDSTSVGALEYQF